MQVMSVCAHDVLQGTHYSRHGPCFQTWLAYVLYMIYGSANRIKKPYKHVKHRDICLFSLGVGWERGSNLHLLALSLPYSRLLTNAAITWLIPDFSEADVVPSWCSVWVLSCMNKSEDCKWLSLTIIIHYNNLTNWHVPLSKLTIFTSHYNTVTIYR